MIPEEGNPDDFKRALLDALPPVSRYPRQIWSASAVTKWAVLLNGGLGIARLVVIVINTAYGVLDWWDLFNVSAALVHFGCVRFVIHVHKSSEFRMEETYEELRVYRDECREFSYWLLQDDIEQRMANMIRRSWRKSFSDYRVNRRNRRHAESRQCPCCMQISYGLGSQAEGVVFNQTVYTFQKNCPLCGWDWT